MAHSLTQARSLVVDYLPSLMENYQQIFVRNPAESLHIDIYFKPLTPYAWIAVIGFIVIIPIVIFPIMWDCKYEHYIIYKMKISV